MSQQRIYGLLAEFETPEAIIEAARGVRAAGYERVEAYTPFPVEGLPEALGYGGNRLPLLVLIGGVTGGVIGYALQYYLNAVNYPIDVGGKPLHSWPAFIVITFELTVLFAGLTAVIGMLALNRLPQPYHPLFNVERFARASRDAFFLCLESTEPGFDPHEAHRLLEEAGAKEVWRVAP